MYFAFPAISFLQYGSRVQIRATMALLFRIYMFHLEMVSIFQNYNELITNWVPVNISVFDFSFQKFYQYYKQKIPKSLLTNTKMGCQDYLNAFIKSCKTYWEVVKKVFVTQGPVVHSLSSFREIICHTGLSVFPSRVDSILEEFGCSR